MLGNLGDEDEKNKRRGKRPSSGKEGLGTLWLPDLGVIEAGRKGLCRS